MNKLHRFGVGVGVLALLMLLSIAGCSAQQIEDNPNQQIENSPHQQVENSLHQQPESSPSQWIGGNPHQQPENSPNQWIGGNPHQQPEDSPRPFQAAKVTDAKASAIEMTKIKLTWKTQGEISQIRIFRTIGGGYKKSTEKIAVLKGGAESYVDTVKYNRRCRYKIVAYQKEGKKYKRLNSNFCVGFSGVAPIVWDEYSYCEAMTTPESIHLEAYVQEGLRPDGFEIFRRTDGEKFECIKTVEADKDRMWLLDYTDRTVQSHQVYYYKLRTFRTIDKKKYYSVFSDEEKHTAVNKEGSFSVKDLTEEGEAISSLIVCLTSDEGNGDLVINDYHAYYYKEEIYGASSSIYPVKYSYDGKKWMSVKKYNAVLKPGQSMYLKFAKEDNQTISYDSKGNFSYDTKGKGIIDDHYKKGKAMIDYMYVRYNDFAYLLSIDLGQLTASARLDGEAYH